MCKGIHPFTTNFSTKNIKEFQNEAYNRTYLAKAKSNVGFQCDASKHVKENYIISASQFAATLSETFRLTGVCIVIQLSTNFVEIWESIAF